MSALSLFTRFNEKIACSSGEWDQAIQRAIDCADVLSRHYYRSAPGEHMTFIGSLAKNTAMTPVGDADVMFHMPAGTFQQYDNYSGNGQSALLQEVRGVLRGHFTRTDIRGDGPVVVVGFTTGCAVEIVPGVLVRDANSLAGKCSVPVTRDGGTWEHSDYGAEWHAINIPDLRTTGQLRRLIHYMKAWRKQQNVTYKSVVLELMTADFMTSWPTTQNSATYDGWLVRGFLAYMVDHYYTRYTLPGSTKSLDPGVWITAAKASLADATSACKLGDSSQYYGFYWRKVLGNDFGS